MTRWTVCILLFLATTLNYLDRQTLSILAPVMQKELGLDNAKLGVLFSVFYYSYTFAQFGIGGLLDRLHIRWAYGVGVLLWSLSAALTSLAGGFGALVFFRLLLGVTESVNWPAAMRIVARVLPPNERSLGNGIFTSGTSIGALIAPGLILGVAGWFGLARGLCRRRFVRRRLVPAVDSVHTLAATRSRLEAFPSPKPPCHLARPTARSSDRRSSGVSLRSRSLSIRASTSTSTGSRPTLCSSAACNPARNSAGFSR